MMQVRPIFVREAALMLAELAQKAAADEGFARALGQGAGPAEPFAPRRPQPERATGFAIHHLMPDGPEVAAPSLAFQAYAARLAERVVLEGPVAAFSLRV
jgi:hypothetical protein